jgi:hypothetical protein
MASTLWVEMRLREWRKGVACLSTMLCPANVSASRWRILTKDAAQFVSSDWAIRAAESGWDAASLFGCHPRFPLERFDCRGVLWGIDGAEIVGVTAAEIIIRLKTGSRLACRRLSAAPGEPIILAWQLAIVSAEDHDQRPIDAA